MKLITTIIFRASLIKYSTSWWSSQLSYISMESAKWQWTESLSASVTHGTMQSQCKMFWSEPSEIYLAFNTKPFRASSNEVHGLEDMLVFLVTKKEIICFSDCFAFTIVWGLKNYLVIIGSRYIYLFQLQTLVWKHVCGVSHPQTLFFFFLLNFVNLCNQ